MKTKQVIVIRKDLNMRKGKMVAQGAHASMAALMENRSFANMNMMVADAMNKEYNPDSYELDTMLIPMTPEMIDWLMGKFTKICVGVDSEEELLAVYEKARECGIICSLIQDSGLTEFDGVPTYTAVAVGAGDSEEIDKITGDLKLL